MDKKKKSVSSEWGEDTQYEYKYKKTTTTKSPAAKGEK